MPVNWDIPRGHAPQITEKNADHARRFNPQIDITYNGDEIDVVTKTAVDGTAIEATFTWVGGNLTQITRYTLV